MAKRAAVLLCATALACAPQLASSFAPPAPLFSRSGVAVSGAGSATGRAQWRPYSLRLQQPTAGRVQARGQAVAMSGEVGVESGAGAAGQAQGGLREGSHVVDGLRAHYTVADPPDANRVAGATPLIFIHGMGGSAAHFSKNLLPIAAACGAPVYAVDLLGSCSPLI